MKFVSAWFGKPSAPIAIADFADPNSAPFESGTLLMASMAAEDSKLAGINLVHELVHSALPSSRPWVYEGLAHFAEAMYRQEQGGRQAALDFLGLHRAAFLDSEKEVSTALHKSVDQKNVGQKIVEEKSAGQPLASTFDETYYRSKAAYVWWMLRDMAGDDALKEAIRKYRAEDDNDKAPKYVEQLIEAASKRGLSWFFDDWVYQDRGLPDFHVQSVHPWKTEKGVQFITVTLENLGSAGAEVPFTVIFEGGEITKRIEVRAKATATTRVELPGTASRIVVNDGSVPESDLTNNVFKISSP
jgi:aminopeptidase N